MIYFNLILEAIDRNNSYQDALKIFNTLSDEEKWDVCPKSGFLKNVPTLLYRHVIKDEGHDVGAIVVGPKVHPFKEALSKSSLSSRVDLIDPVYIFPIEEDNVKMLQKYDYLLIYDCYGIENGYADQLIAKLYEAGYRGRILSKAVPNRFLYLASASQLEQDLGLSIPQVMSSLEEFVK